jgi:hypothetical protein
MSNSATPNLRALARRVLAFQAGSDKCAGSDAGAGTPFRVIEQMRVPLGRLVGFGGFRSLLCRALALAAADNATLQALRIKGDGQLEGIGDLEAKLDGDELARAELLLLTELLGLLVTFIGAALTMQLLHEIWPEVDDRSF